MILRCAIIVSMSNVSQVPRTYHNGIKGTFMNLETHNKYFRDIGYNTDPAVSWPPSDVSLITGPASTAASGGDSSAVAAVPPASIAYMQGHHAVNQYRVEELVKRCKHVTSVMDLLTYKGTVSVVVRVPLLMKKLVDQTATEYSCV